MSYSSSASSSARPRDQARLGRVRARLVLEDGTVVSGRVFGAGRSVAGEVVFATGMVGYPESLTDPSFAGQILVLTYPLAGNYGVPERGVTEPGLGTLPHGFESDRIHVRALVVATLSPDYSHWDAHSSLDTWLAEQGVVGLEGVDTRALTKRLRAGGTVAGKLIVDGDARGDVRDDTPFEDISQTNLVAAVSVDRPVLYGSGSPRVILVDTGAKANIVRSLVRRGASVLRVPWDHDFNQEDGDGVLISNGPGDPKRADRTIAHTQTALAGDRPLFGICLGNQLVGLAAGCDTYKMKFGHRSQNQPCIEVGTPRCYITSQNHGYAVDATTLPADWEEWFVNANDGSNEGIRHRSKPFWTVQFHPEATPGPEDTNFLFDRFLEQLR
ncbi:MAG: glutamine-hydrolyzing carbamoyl-phosphate synthase small subunit [Planctomycetota bacterium]